MKFSEKYKNTESTNDKPCDVVAEMLRHTPPAVEPVLAGLDFATVRELSEAYTAAWFAAATDKYLLAKPTQMFMPQAKLLLQRAQKLCTNPNMERMMNAAAEGLWLQRYERMALETRRNAVFSGEKDAARYQDAKRKIVEIYRYSEADMERVRYFVCQARRDDSDPALNRSLYIWSAEKMTGKTTVAKIVAGILNGWQTWQEVTRNAGGFLSDIPCELQFGTFDRPKGTRNACVVMDEAFAGKTTAKYYGKFKTALTSDTCDVQIKFGGTYPVKCTRNYIFTSNNDIASVVADESERRMMVIKTGKPQQLPYAEIFDMWRDYIVNAPDEEDVAAWYVRTAQEIKGEKGIQREDIASAFLSEDFRARLTDRQAISQYQLAYPHFFTQYITAVFDVKSRVEVVKEAVQDVFGEPKVSGTRKYYNITDVLQVVNNAVNAVSPEGYDMTAQQYEFESNGDDLPY